MRSRILIITATFYKDVADALTEGATAALEDCDIDTVEVPGALEIPGAITIAASSGAGYDGYVALGCVIRGETTHYDYVCGESARGLMDLSLMGIPVGNGILTVETREQALERAIKRNKGAAAANAVMTLIAIRDRFEAAND
ncbi:MAG: 6,7-dimethyl-8-ribityllumazine synthase [Maricaulis sp.]|jgi:6,7-dimethyl-8-ribityllumazine synthase|nr:6,7-dimethyl-8-ribityllumazine synthase [Maricaulis sp.]HAQ36779.1 6,7-dimethyl-8-ribityllumazine synthase [Alphaproteobacteria bacterium]|tara:strand:+ start:476 stop:901 length:426 start_codon:yes stop_codon:yes gene_type:complete